MVSATPRMESRLWRCVNKKDSCKGRLYTLNGSLVSVIQPHNHCSADIADCEVREALSQVHDLYDFQQLNILDLHSLQSPE